MVQLSHPYVIKAHPESLHDEIFISGKTQGKIKFWGDRFYSNSVKMELICHYDASKERLKLFRAKSKEGSIWCISTNHDI